MQVADRFHLLQNLQTAFENLLYRQTSVLKHSYQMVMNEALSALKQRVADQEEPESIDKFAPTQKIRFLLMRSTVWREVNEDRSDF